MDTLGRGAWCWFQAPRAVRHVGDADRTWTGWVTPGGDVAVGYREHDTGATGARILHADFERDDHDNPAFHLTPDGRLLVFYTRHGGPAIHYRVVGPASFTVGPERTISPSTEHTYPNPRTLDGRLHLFYRNAAGSVAYVVHEGGDDWTAERELVTTGGREWCVYPHLSAPAGGRVVAALTFAEGGNHEPHRDVRCVAFDGERLQTVDGRDLGGAADGVPFAETPVVYDSGAGHDAWVWDCAHADAPEIVYATFPTPEEHVYRYARWTGEEWRDRYLADGDSYIVSGNDELYYSGGVTLDPAERGVCYLSAGDHSGSTLQRYERDGEGWRTTTVADGEQNVRPVVPWNRHPEEGALWLRGSYTHYADGGYDTRIVGQD
jgi:hypothetical protein